MNWSESRYNVEAALSAFENGGQEFGRLVSLRGQDLVTALTKLDADQLRAVVLVRVVAEQIAIDARSPTPPKP